jgi:hypothetical protein
MSLKFWDLIGFVTELNKRDTWMRAQNEIQRFVTLKHQSNPEKAFLSL